MNASPPGSDPVYKRLYAFPEMVADLLRSPFPDDTLGADYDSLRRLPAEYVGDDYRQRRGDSVWQLRADAGVAAEGGAGHGRLYVLLMLEFQARNDRGMAVRILEYTAMLYRELLREGSVRGGRRAAAGAAGGSVQRRRAVAFGAGDARPGGEDGASACAVPAVAASCGA